MSITSAVGYIILIRCKAAQRHTDEVHEVISGKSHRQGESAHQYNNFHYIHLADMQQLHQHRKESETREDNQSGMSLDPALDLRGHESKVFCALDEQEIYYCRGADSSENPDFPFEIVPVVEGEYHSGYKLHHSAEEKRYRYRKEYSEYYRQGLFGVQQVVESEVDTTGHFYQSHYKCSSEKLEHH